jgi:hypothetical protein
MSTIKVTNIQDTSGGNSSTSEEIFQGRAKVWLNFDGSGTVSIRDDFNVSSIADDGTGTYTVTFSTAMANTNYVTFGTVEESGVSVHCSANNSVTQTATTVKIGTFLSGTSNGYDCDQINVAVFGD